MIIVRSALRPVVTRKTCCLIGETDVPLGEEKKIVTRARYPIQDMVFDGVMYFGLGGGRGFDMLMADFLLEMRDYYKKRIRIISVLPYPDYMADWPEEEKKRQKEILRRSDKVTYASQEPGEGAFLARDKKLIDGSARCICYCRRTDSHVAAMVRYAMEAGLKVTNACSWDLRQLGIRKNWQVK